MLRLGSETLPTGDVTHVMGVMNVSPESKNKHTVALSIDEALAMADRYRRWGASLIDLGGQSSNIDTPTIEADLEAERVAPVIEALAADGHLVAIDTWKPVVARTALEAGAVIVNDTGGLTDQEMRRVVAENDVAAIAVYVEGKNPHDVGELLISDDKAAVTASRFRPLIAELEEAGITNLIIDPGIALQYRADYKAYSLMQLQVIAQSEHLKELEKPVLIPIPRKRDFHRTLAYISLALEHEADIIRVHDVAVACDLARLFGRGP